MSQESLLSTESTQQINLNGDNHNTGTKDAKATNRIIPWRRIIIWSIWSVVGMFILLLLLDKVVMPWYVKLGSESNVPDVVGMAYPEAEELLKEQGFEVKRTEARYNDKYPAGTVLMQLPYGGARTKEGRRIYLTESRGVEMIPMPDVLSRPLREARITLMRKGFEIGEIEYGHSDTIMRDLIFSQSIPPNVGARPGTKVDLLISQGPETRYAIMPNLVGLSLDAARLKLERAGLSLGVVRKKRSEHERNTVIEQSYSAYGQVAENAAVNITISDPTAPITEEGPAPPEEPEGTEDVESEKAPSVKNIDE